MEVESLSYAQRRALNIARNAERMRAIGLTTIHLASLSPAVQAQKQKLLPVPSSDADVSEREPLGNLRLRRSARTSGLPSRNHNDYLHEQSAPAPGRVRATSFKSHAPRQPPPAASGSSRSMKCDVNKLLQSYIGNTIVPRDGQVKRAVIQLSSNSGVCPSFNRMSGICEWANCVFLFVNVGGSDYDNLLYFSRSSEPRVDDLVAEDSGAACAVMTWFAQPRQDPDTPVLLRMRRSDVEPVLVFFRVVGVPEYIFGGRLQYVAHDAAARPLQFWFRLADWQALHASQGWAKVSEAGGMRAPSR